MSAKWIKAQDNNKDTINPWTAGNAWARTQHCGYWCPGAKAPGHQYPQRWPNIHCSGPVSNRYITIMGNNIRKQNHISWKKYLVVLGLRLSMHYRLFVWKMFPFHDIMLSISEMADNSWMGPAGWPTCTAVIVILVCDKLLHRFIFKLGQILIMRHLTQ